MKIFVVIAVVVVATLSSSVVVEALPSPQEVSADDILGAADSARYSTKEESVDQDLLDDVFGGSPDQKNSPYNSDNENSRNTVDTTSPNCTDYAHTGHSCVAYYLCQDGFILTDGGGLIDIRSGFLPQLDPASSKCPGYLEVCCKDPDHVTQIPVTPKPKAPEPYTSRCGRRNTQGVGVRIENSGFAASTQFGEWPHMCAVLKKKTIAGGEVINLYVCGASLIAPGIVMTGAHCVDKVKTEDMKVRCGEWDTQRMVEPAPHEDRDIVRKVMDHRFNPRNLQKDFALLFLREDFVLSPHIDTICLPERNIYSYRQSDCVATGWGKDKFGKEGEYQVVMKQVEMDVVNNTECERRLRRTRLGTRFRLDRSFMCAGGEAERDTCKGDGGGPLVCPISGGGGGQTRYMQAGIVAWGIDCGVDGNPGVYASVSEALCFIDWAVGCVTGSSSYFNIQGCNNWANVEKRELIRNLEGAKIRLDQLTSSRVATASILRNQQRKINQYKETLKKFEDFESSCVPFQSIVDPYNAGDDQDDDDTDLASLARTGQKLTDVVDEADDDDEEEIDDDDEEISTDTQ